MLVGVEEDCDIPVGCLEDARDEEDLRQPESDREVNQGTQTALADGDNVLPRFEQRCQARPNSDGGCGAVHPLLPASVSHLPVRGRSCRRTTTVVKYGLASVSMHIGYQTR